MKDITQIVRLRFAAASTSNPYFDSTDRYPLHRVLLASEVL